MSLDPRVSRLRAALRDREPFCSGTCAIPDYQRILYYNHGGSLRCVDFTNAGVDDLEALYRACKPAEFGRNGENVLDESYRKAGKLDLISFATQLDPRSLGIHEKVSKALLTASHSTMELELYKLNVYGKGDFFKAHKDTPRGLGMFGSLVVVLPTVHEGGQLVLRKGGKEWTLDFADKFATTEPSVCFVAFYGETEHEVLPVTSGHRVTLTYNLYHQRIHPSTSSITTPFYLNLKQTMADLLNDKSILPNGGYLGFGLTHEYVRTEQDLVDFLYDQLKGADLALADVCDQLDLSYSLRLLYRQITHLELNLISTDELYVYDGSEMAYEDSPDVGYLQQAIGHKTRQSVECINFVGGQHQFDPEQLEEDESWLEPFYKAPVTEVLEVTKMKSSVTTETSWVAYGNEPELGYFYGTACMLVEVEPAESRQIIELRGGQGAVDRKLIGSV